MTFKNIIVPHDFEIASDHALDNAIKIAKLVKDSKITIFHVLENIEILETLASLSKPLYSVKTGELTTKSAYVKEIYHELRSTALKKLEEKKQKCEKEVIMELDFHLPISFAFAL
jgi:nucleotide-binding universal stress UspA family protein